MLDLGINLEEGCDFTNPIGASTAVDTRFGEKQRYEVRDGFGFMSNWRGNVYIIDDEVRLYGYRLR